MCHSDDGVDPALRTPEIELLLMLLCCCIKNVPFDTIIPYLTRSCTVTYSLFSDSSGKAGAPVNGLSPHPQNAVQQRHLVT